MGLMDTLTGGLFDKFSGGKDKGSPTNTTTGTSTSQNVPQWQEMANKDLYNQARASMGKGTGERVFAGQRVAPLSGAQNQAINNAWQSYGSYQPQANEAANMLRQQYNQNPAQVGTTANSQKIDFNRYTGNTPDTLFNDYFQKIYKPAAANFNDEARSGMNDFDQQHAFGNQRSSSEYALGKSQLEKNRLSGLSNLESDVFQRAMNAFQGEEGRLLQSQQAQAGINQNDLARMLQADTSNQAAGLQNKGLNMQNATSMLQNIASQYGMNANDISRLFNLGTSEQNLAQRQNDTEMQKFNEYRNFDRSELEWLQQFLNKNPGGTLESSTSSTQATPPKASGMETAMQLGAQLLPYLV